MSLRPKPRKRPSLGEARAIRSLSPRSRRGRALLTESMRRSGLRLSVSMLASRQNEKYLSQGGRLMRMRGSFLAVTALAMLVMAPAQAQAQDWPNRPVTFITPAAAGNSPDVVTRIIADR